MPGEAMVKLYCPKCMDVYTPKSSRHHHILNLMLLYLCLGSFLNSNASHIDGVYFGTGFPHMLFMVHPELRPPRPTNQFVPRLDMSLDFHLLYSICYYH